MWKNIQILSTVLSSLIAAQRIVISNKFASKQLLISKIWNWYLLLISAALSRVYQICYLRTFSLFAGYAGRGDSAA